MVDKDLNLHKANLINWGMLKIMILQLLNLIKIKNGLKVWILMIINIQE